jgi:hypothetical protein
MALLFLLDRIYGIISKFEHALFSGRRIKGNRQIGRVIILFDPEHFNDVMIKTIPVWRTPWEKT